MTPASARSLRRARVAELRQAEPDLSHREMAQRLGLSKDTVRRDLEAIEEDVAQSAPPAERPEPAGADGVAQTAPQVSAGGAPRGAQDAPVARLPQRVAQPLDGVDLSKWPAVRRDLAVLAQTGRAAEALAHQAITALAHHYGRALARGDIEPGRPFIVSDMTLRPLPAPAASSVSSPAQGT